MAQKDSKTRLFEVMSRVDNTFKAKAKLNEEFDYNQSVEEPSMEEGRLNRANPKYTHFALLRDTDKIITGWDYKGYDQTELNSEKKWYFFNDIIDMEIDPKTVKILTTRKVQSMGIDPFDFNNWNKDNGSLEENIDNQNNDILNQNATITLTGYELEGIIEALASSNIEANVSNAGFQGNAGKVYMKFQDGQMKLKNALNKLYNAKNGIDNNQW